MKKNDIEKVSFFEKIAAFIVDKRNIFFLIFICGGIFSLFSSGWVNVENDITKYLPETTETRIGVDLMDKEFITYDTAEVMVTNVSFQRAEMLADKIRDISGVSEVAFENDDEHFKNSSALFSVTFKGHDSDEVSTKSMEDIKLLLSGYDLYINSEVGSTAEEDLQNDMNIILVIAAVIIILVLLFTSKSYAEVPILLITFVAAAILNKGTNFMLGKISFISDSVAVVLQLALAIDYAIILCHRFTEEREHLEQREAMIQALSKGIPEIFSSSLTTISGLAALATMQFKIGPDLAIVLIKAILLSLLSVFTLMPGLIMIFGKYMEKTKHKNLVPNIPWVGKFCVKTKYIIPPIFLVLMVAGFFLSSQTSYCYSEGTLTTVKQNPAQFAKEKIKNTFKQTNAIAVIVPTGDYEKEAALLAELEKCEGVKETVGLANSEALDGYMLTESITAREFGEMTDVDYEMAKLLYAAYAVDEEEYGQVVGNLDGYSVPIIDMLEFLHKEINEGYVSLDDDKTEQINEIYDTIQDAKRQLKTDKNSRLLVISTLPEEGKETFELLDEMHEIIAKYYDSGAYIVGNSTSAYDLATSFSRDNIIISILSALFVVVVLLFTFKSAGLSILLIAVIQGSIWINFSFPFIMGQQLFFLGYLVVSSIQMGANIDYAIVISSRFSELKKEMNTKDAVIETINQAFPTIITSGSILAAAGILIWRISTNGIIASVGECLGRGTIMSILLVFGVLPQLLLIGNTIVEKTALIIKTPELKRKETGRMFVNGRVIGKISGVVDANIHGVVIGDIDAIVRSENISNDKPELPEKNGEEMTEHKDEEAEHDEK